MPPYLEKECGVDGLHLSRAVHLHDECMWAPSLIHGGFSADYVTEIKRAVSVPIITVGRYTEPQYAELMIAEGRADLVAFGRQSIADPEMPNKAKAGRLDLMNPCIGCLQGCVPICSRANPSPVWSTLWQAEKQTSSLHRQRKMLWLSADTSFRRSVRSIYRSAERPCRNTV